MKIFKSVLFLLLVTGCTTTRSESLPLYMATGGTEITARDINREGLGDLLLPHRLYGVQTLHPVRSRQAISEYMRETPSVSIFVVGIESHGNQNLIVVYPGVAGSASASGIKRAENKTLQEYLLERGLARVEVMDVCRSLWDEKDKSINPQQYIENLQKIEEKARSQKVGMWADKPFSKTIDDRN